jgi:hypothetical protein
MNPENSQTSPPKAEDVQKEQSATLAESESSTENAESHTRKPALSKREIMEQLSRERFPWDE